ncbi:hypothetical protein EDD66_10636 [Mobilisporobacter senegalensis]|uniref:Uncharacterized protein n=1 Tax=Mobilisporobacter senegalensis TaxID=1329262 RepID=A0A3N1XMH6_9FIRM|nr:hypothetical protein [Mobilisporobacter senegalensis]ROR27341.1 hypothetical protein EDD66_10636 [Mobilisporobacter senegalensis]
MRNLTLLELDELYSLLEKLQKDDRLPKYTDEARAVELLKRYIKFMSLRSDTI